MKRMRMRWLRSMAVGLGLVGLAFSPQSAESACCYFSAKDKDILQPGQKVFLTYDPSTRVETFTVQPKFEGNALDFGMVIPTPAQPKLDEMPRDFFKELAIYSILSSRQFPNPSRLLPQRKFQLYFDGNEADCARCMPMCANEEVGLGFAAPRKPKVVVLEQGVVGSLNYKVIKAERADDLYDWLKTNKYSYAGDEATLDFYVKKNWYFTVMKIDTMQMKKGADGSFTGEVTPTRFTFTSDKLVYPLKITQLSVKDKTEALFYVQAPEKMDLEGDFSYQYNWVPLLQSASGCTPSGLPGGGGEFLKAIAPEVARLNQRANRLGFQFVSGARPTPNEQGREPSTLEWARKLTGDDVKILTGDAPYCERLPNFDEGFTADDCKDPQRAEAIYKVITQRIAKSQKSHPNGYLVRKVPEDDVKALKILSGHLKEGQYLTKFRKVFTKDEMNEDLVLVPAKVGQQVDRSEYTEILPTSPP